MIGRWLQALLCLNAVPAYIAAMYNAQSHILARILRLFMPITLLVLAGQAMAQGRIHVSGNLVSATSQVRAGEETFLALAMIPDSGWHGYWVNGGDAGFGMELTWTVPKGVTVGEPLYPVPQTYILQGLMNHVYEQPYAILIPVSIGKDVVEGTTLTLKADGNWLACSDKLCLPQEGSFTTQLSVIGANAPLPSPDRRFAEWQAKLPSPLNAQAGYAIDGTTMTLTIPYPSGAPLEGGHFFAETDGMIDYAAPQEFDHNGDVLTITTKAAEGAKAGEPLHGLLKIGPDMGLSVSATANTNNNATGGGIGWGALDSVGGFGGLLLTLGAAFLGGVLLNIMPCVFPILGLKAVALANGGQDEAKSRRDALSYTMGVMATTMALGGILLMLRAAGEQVGWAFQLQNPAVVFFLLLLMVTITLNLLGLFEVPALGGVGTVSAKSENSFLTGALAAFVATPCTGPFMAAALGAALILPAWAALALFAALGLGIALPFLALGFVPAFRKALPRPGPWLSAFRKWMAIPMALTSLALIWLWGQMGGAFWLAAIGIAALVTVLYLVGKGQASGRSAAPMLTAAAALFIAAPAAITAFPVLTSTQPPANADENAIAFSAETLAELRAKGTPVFLYFTADWCITCKANEAAVLNREAMADVFTENGVTVMRGDFTRRDATISAFLTEKGRAGVPLYLYYPKGKEPQELPQILTINSVEAIISSS